MNARDIVGWTPCKPTTLGKFNQTRAALIKNGWRVDVYSISPSTLPCPNCKNKSVVTTSFFKSRQDERTFDVCFTCGVVTEQKPIFADGKSA